jgi:hypothetical protein
MPLRTMNSPNRLLSARGCDRGLESLETQLKAVTAERDMYNAKVKKLEGHVADTVNVSVLRDTFITSVLEVFAYFLR